jgi:4-carboxymuconolactone decarboxylase
VTGRDPIPSAVAQTSSSKSVADAAEHQRPLRAEPIPPQQLTGRQQTYYQQSKQEIEQQFPSTSRSSAIADNGALLGPWSVWMATPDLGTAFAAVQGTISALQALPPRAQQVVTLLTAASQRAAYELAGHRTIAITQGFTADEADALTEGYAPSTLAPAEQLAANATHCLLVGGPLPEPLYQELLDTFGSCGPVHLCSLVGQYLFLSVTLNTFDVPVPD